MPPGSESGSARSTHMMSWSGRGETEASGSVHPSAPWLDVAGGGWVVPAGGGRGGGGGAGAGGRVPGGEAWPAARSVRAGRAAAARCGQDGSENEKRDSIDVHGKLPR